MILGRLGLVEFFGILVPGIYLTGTLLAALVGGIVMSGIVAAGDVLSVFEKTTLAASSVFLLVSYLLGVLMRLLGPDPVDKLSTWYFRRIRGKEDTAKNTWMFESFPYRQSMKSAFEKLGMIGVLDFLEKLNPEYASADSTLFFNYCKLVLEGNCLEVAKLAAQAEAMVRFLSGSALAFLISAIVWFLCAIGYVFVSHVYALISGLCSVASICFLWPILARFKFQRRREVQLVWTSVYLLLRGGLPNARQVSPAELQVAIDPKLTLVKK